MSQSTFPFVDQETKDKYQASEPESGVSTTSMTEPTPKAAYDFLKKEEGLKLVAYQNEYKDPKTGKMRKDRPTIGYGSTFKPDGTPVTPGEQITQEDADNYLKAHVENQVLPYLRKFVKVPLNQNQTDALTSLIYNIGGQRFVNSDLLKKLNSKDYAGAAKAFTDFHKGVGVDNLLLQRRLREQDLFKKVDKQDIINTIRAKLRRT